MCPAKYTEKFAGKYLRWCPQLCARLHEHVCLLLNLSMYLYLYLYLYLMPHAAPFRKPFSSSFRYLQGLMYPSLLVLVNLAPCRRMLPPRQSVGRPLHGRIVVRDRRTTTYGWRLAPWTAAAELPLFRKNAVLQSASCGTDRTCVQERLRVKALAPELRRSLRHSVPRLAADSTRGSTPDSTRG